MLSLVGLVCKQYWERLGGGVVPEVFCPDPQCQGARLRGHGWYSRYIGEVRQLVRRVRCPRCRVSHALLPEDLCAYRDASLGAVEAALCAGRPSAAARVAEQAGRRGVRRVRGWLRSEGAPWTEKLKALLPAAGGTWWRRVQEMVGEAAGWLLRLRRWLWSSWSRFLGGVSGLYRQGRPERRPPPPSP
jgi:Domain of unknown function (DUF6431)